MYGTSNSDEKSVRFRIDGIKGHKFVFPIETLGGIVGGNFVPTCPNRTSIELRCSPEEQTKKVRRGTRWSIFGFRDLWVCEDGVQRVMEAAILQKGDPVEVANVLKEVQDTYRDVRRLEASIIELHKMFMDLALLVDQQGEMLDQIEYQVKSAADYVRDANTDIERAIETSKTIRRRQCCLLIIVLIIVAIIVIVIITTSN